MKHQGWNSYAGATGEVYTGKSKAIPGMTLPLKTLVDRFVRGQNVTTFEPVYLGDEEFPDVERMDPMERLDLARDIRDGIDEVRRKSSFKKQAEKEAEKPNPDPPLRDDVPAPDGN